MAEQEGNAEKHSQQAPPNEGTTDPWDGHIVIIDGGTNKTVCRMMAACLPANSSANQKQKKQHCHLSEGERGGVQGKSVKEVVEAVGQLTGIRSCLLVRDPGTDNCVVLTNSDHIGPGRYYLRHSHAGVPKPPSHATLGARVVAVLVALLTLGLLMQLLVFALVFPMCGWNVKCLLDSYKVFIAHIDGPFKMFTFAAAMQRAAAHPDVWLKFLRRMCTLKEWALSWWRPKIFRHKKRD